MIQKIKGTMDLFPEDTLLFLYMEGFKHILYRANEKVRNILEKWPCNGASLVAQLIESPPAMQETWI